LDEIWLARIGDCWRAREQAQVNVASLKSVWPVAEEVSSSDCEPLGGVVDLAVIADGRTNRRLATIVHMDIVGYTRLVAADDLATSALIRRWREEIVEAEMVPRGGRLIQTGGDSLLLTFHNILGAVEFALAAQRKLAIARPMTSTGSQLLVRVGIDIGDTIADRTDLHGDGVIIAVRLEGMCPPGGVCVSRTVHDHVENRIGPRFRALGPVSLKNVRRPVEAYCLTMEELLAPSSNMAIVARRSPDAERAETLTGLAPSETRSASPPRNSIAVLPFVSFGAKATEEYFADGVVDDIITELSHFKNLFVIARNSSFSYKNRNIDVREVARDLGVDYVVEGSIRRTSGRVRLLARLVLARTGAQVWAERFDYDMKDIFALQDIISQRIAVAIEPQIMASERARARRKPTENLDAYDYYLRALPHLEQLCPTGHISALRLLGESIRLDPAFAPALAVAGACHFGMHDQGWSTDPGFDKAEGLRLARAALSHGEDDAQVLCLAGHTVAGLAEAYPEASELLDRALELNPNYAQAWFRSSMVRVYLNDPETALVHADRALSLSPRDPRLFMPLCAKGYAYLLLGDYDAAVRMARRTLTLATKPEMAYRILITALWRLGRTEEMRSIAAAMIEQIPGFRIGEWRARVSFTRNKRFDIMLEALRDAGLPE
jgi:adenylate cyclase